MSTTSLEPPGELSFMNLLTSGSDSPPHSIAYVGPSVTPVTNLNMGYKIYSLDGNYTDSSYVSSFPVVWRSLVPG